MQIAGNAKEKEWQKKSLFLPTKHSFLGSFLQRTENLPRPPKGGEETFPSPSCLGGELSGAMFCHGQTRIYSDFSFSHIATDKHGLTRTIIVADCHGQTRTHSDSSLSHIATDKHGLTRTFRYRSWPRTSTDSLGLLLSQMATDKHGLTRTFRFRRWPRTSTDSLGLFVIAYSHGQARTHSDFSLSHIATDKHGLTRTFHYRR